jgi:hypothetical protein
MIHEARRFSYYNRLLALLATLACLALSRPSAAQVSDSALAESLFRDAKRLMNESKFSEACPKFAESYRLDPGLGTLLNLAACHEAEGKIASAWAEFSDAVARARRDGDQDRLAFAEERVRSLEPRLPRLVISLQAGASVPGLVVKLDGREISSAAFGVAVPVDPGNHQVQANAPGKQPWAHNVQAPAQAANLAVSVPPLQDAGAGPAPAPAPTPTPAPGAAEPGGHPPPAPAPAETPKKSKTGVIIAGVATGALVVGAVVTGVLYNGKKDDFEKADSIGAPNRFSKRDEAQTMGIVNAVLIGGAAVGAGVTLILLATSSSSSESPPQAAAALELTPVFGPDGGGLSLRGRL